MIEKYIKMEKKKQDRSVQLIASENFVSQDVLNAQGSILTNKYAEGYPHHRYYGGCEVVDMVEEYTQKKALEMFGNPVGYKVNVQPHSGSQANQAVYLTALNPGDKVLAMSLDHGGHLTHGFKLSSSGHYYDFVHYHTKNGHLDYEEIAKLLQDNKPKLLVVGASAYPFEIDFAKIKKIVEKVSPETLIMADIAHIAGLIVGKKHKTPFGYCDFITSTTHKTLRGPRGGVIFCKEEFYKKLNRSVFPGIQGGPLMHVIAAKGVAFNEACQEDYYNYIEQLLKNMQAFDRKLNELGVKTSGSENHLLLVDVYKSFGIDGALAQDLLEKEDIITNKNLLPNDPLTAAKPSGLRMGTPAMTTKGYNEIDFENLAVKIFNILNNYRKKEIYEYKL